MSSLKDLSISLRRLPITLAADVARASADTMTALAQRTFDSSANAYGIAWIPGAEGQEITLRKSGALARGIRYVAIGTKLRMALTVRYAKYQVGKRRVAPGQGEPLPKDYADALKAAAAKAISEALR